MSNTEYSTDRANYRQVYAVHTTPIKDEIFSGDKIQSVDAIVLEMAHDDKLWKLLWESEHKKHYEPIFNAVQGTDKPVYVVDVLTTPGGRGFENGASFLPDFLGLYALFDGVNKVHKQIKEKKEMSRRQFLKFWGAQTAKVVGGAYLGSDLVCRQYPTQTGENPEFLARLNSSRMHLIPTPQFELRNAISARKIEEYVAPELQEQLGRKPNIVLVYGAGHSGLKEDLQHRKLRDFYIGLYDTLGFPGIDLTHLETITNLQIDQKGQYSLRHTEADLF